MKLSQFHYTGNQLYRQFQNEIDLGKKILFIINFLGKAGYIIPVEFASELGVFYKTPKESNMNFVKDCPNEQSEIKFEKFPVPFSEYFSAFEKVQSAEKNGQTYLLNLTFPCTIKTNATLWELFNKANSPFKLFLDNQFAVFSPEPFLKIIDGKISSFPMKGTSWFSNNLNPSPDKNNKITREEILLKYESALEKILNNSKEIAEHATMVDLIRNDLNLIAKKVFVKKYRYPETIRTKNKNLIQLSTQITGQLPLNYSFNLANILKSQLPAGSISGAPKKRTLALIKEIETYDRGYYTGVFGISDGKNLESAVMIRFIENQNGKFIFKSGGGITSQSVAEDEYEELIQKINIPTK